MNELEFQAWPKIPRGKGEEMTISEKIDGTNACIVIQGGEIVGVQSRKRFITPEDDNYGFAKWVEENQEELLKLGEGHHYGEWAGQGIQSNPRCLPDKRFFLFNTARWSNREDRPECCHVVPVLFNGAYTFENIDNTLEELWDTSEGVYVPEGIVVWFHKTRRYEKYTFKNEKGKWSK